MTLGVWAAGAGAALLLAGCANLPLMSKSADAPGAYAEQMLVQESLMMPVPNGLDTDVAALTEPMSVGWHAVRRADVGNRRICRRRSR